MLAWKVDYVLPDDAAKPEIDLDYDYWDPKVEGDAFSKRRLNSAKVDSTPGTLSFVILLSPKESLITLNGKEFRGKGSSLITDKKSDDCIAPHARFWYRRFYVDSQTEHQNTAGSDRLLF